MKSKFERVLGKKDVFALAFGAMIGWGWVVMAGQWILTAGTLGAILAFAIGGLMVVFVGLTYAELTSAMPQCGGEHIFSLRALKKNGSFICTWSIILGYVGVVAFEACAFPTVIQYIYPHFLKGYMYTIAGFEVYASWVLVGVAASIGISFINYFGAKPAALLNTILTITIAAIGIALIAGSAVTGSAANLTPLLSHGQKGVLSVVIMTPFWFVGFDVIPQAAEEINIPFKSIGRLLILSIVMAVAWYMLIILAVSLVMKPAEMSVSSLVTADAMKAAFFNSDKAATVLIIGGMAGILTSWNSFFIGGSRAIFSLAEGKMLPSFLAKLHPQYKTPTSAILLIGLTSCIAPFFGRAMMVWLTDAGSFGVVLAYLLVAISFLVLRKKHSDMPRPYKVKYGYLIGSCAVILSAFFLTLYLPGMPSGLVAQEWFIIGVWTLLGGIFYAVARKRFGARFGHHEIFQIEHFMENKEVSLASL